MPNNTTTQKITPRQRSNNNGGAWGTITGTLSNQTDLQAALDALTAAIPTNNDQLANGAGYLTSITATMIGAALSFSGTNNKQVLYNDNGNITGNDAFLFDRNAQTLTINSINSSGNDVTIRDSFQANMAIAPTSANLPGGAFTSQGYHFFSGSATKAAARWYNFPGASGGMGSAKINTVIIQHSLTPSTGSYTNLLTLASGDSTVHDGSNAAIIATFPGRITVGSTATFTALAGSGSRMVVASSSGVLSTQSIPVVPTNVSSFTNDAGYLTSVPAQSFASLTGKPTTLSGYGITDATPSARNISTTSPITGGGNLSADRTIAFDFSVANTFTAAQTVSLASLGAATATAIYLKNPTAAAVNAQQYSPALVMEGQGWKTTATAASQPVSFTQYVVPIQGTTAPSASKQTWFTINNGTPVLSSVEYYDGTVNAIRVQHGLSASGQFAGLYIQSFGGGAIVGGLIGNTQSGEIRFGGFNSGGYFPTFYSNNAEVARFVTAGRLLIGTTTDDGSNKLQVNGSANLSGNLAVTGGSLTVGTNGVGAVITCASYNRGNSSVSVGTSGGNSVIISGGQAPQGGFIQMGTAGTGGNTSAFWINASGNIGIGGASTAGVGWLQIIAGTTANAQLHLTAGVAPTTPNNGDIWFDGTNIKMQIGGVTKTFTLT